MTVNDNINNPHGGDGRRVRTRSMGHLPEYDPTALEEHLADIRRAARRGAAVAAADGTNGEVIENNGGNENLVSRGSENPAGEALNASPIAATTNNNNDFTFDTSFGTPTSAIRRIAVTAAAFNTADDDFVAQTYVRETEFTSTTTEFRNEFTSIQEHLARAAEARNATDDNIRGIQQQLAKAEEARVASESNMQEIMAGLQKTMTNLSVAFATKEDMKQSSEKVEEELKNIKEEMKTSATKVEMDMKELTDKVQSITNSTEKWMEEQLVKIDETISEAEKTTNKFYTEGVDLVAKQIKQQVNKLTEAEISDAKEKLDKFTSQTITYQEEIKANTTKCQEILAQLKVYESKYGATSREVDGMKTNHNEYATKVDALKRTMKEVLDIVSGKMKEIDSKLTALDTLSDLATEVTKNRTDIEKTVASFDRRCDETVKKLKESDETNARISRDYKYIEGFIKRVLKDEQQRGPFLLRLIAIEEKCNRIAELETKINAATKVVGGAITATTHQNTEQFKTSAAEIEKHNEEIATLQAQVETLLQAPRQATGFEQQLTVEQVVGIIQAQFEDEGRDIDHKFQEQLRALAEIEDNISNILSQSNNKGSVDITYDSLDEHIRIQIKELIEEKSKELADIIQQCTERVNKHNQIAHRGSNEGKGNSGVEEETEVVQKDIGSGRNENNQGDGSGKTGGEQDPNDPYDEEERPRHSGYIHIQSRERAIAFHQDSHRKLIENDFIWKKDFKTRVEAIKWTEEKEEQEPTDQSQSRNRPTPWARRGQPSPSGSSPRYNGSGDRELRGRDSEYDEMMEQAWLDTSVDGYFEDGTAFYIDSRGRNVRHPTAPHNMALAGQYIQTQKDCNRAKHKFDREDFADRYGDASPHQTSNNPYSPYARSEYGSPESN
jgi:septal ring factor EnvC (AmiA/AmiB activator)